MATRFIQENVDPAVNGYLHTPDNANGDGIVLAHGAGSNCTARLLVEMSESLEALGFTVLRIDLPFRVARASGPPRPGDAERDRRGIREAAQALQGMTRRRVYVGGHSYGGRQASMLLAEDAGAADGLLLLSYPLHPPKKPDQLRTKHFAQLTRPMFFAHGTRDPFGSIAEMKEALKLIAARHAVLPIDGAGHELIPRKAGSAITTQIAQAFLAFVRAS